MNAQSHRLIFNSTRGCLMAVAETSRSCGKGRSSGRKLKTRTCPRISSNPITSSIYASNRLLAPVASAQAAINSIASGGSINITETQTSNASQTEQKFSQSGLSVTLTNPIISALQGVQDVAQAASQTKSGRAQALAAASGALTGYNTYKGLTDQVGNLDASKASSINISVSLGSSTSQSTTNASASNAQASTLTAGHDITLNATGAGQAQGTNPGSNLTVQGSTIGAANSVTLQADNDIALLAAQNTAHDQSSNASSGGRIGVGFALGSKNGFTIEAGATAAQGSGDGQGVSYSNTQIAAGNTVTLKSGKDSTLQGAVIAANTVKVDVAGNLKIESLQDTSTYKSQQSSASVGVSLCIPPFCFGASSVSASAGNAKADGNFASVTEQSGIKTGDGGFNVNVQGNTDLKGGVITSTDKAVADNKNSFQTGGQLTLSDIQNKANFDASGYSVSAGLSGVVGNQSASASTPEQKTAAAPGADIYAK